VLEAVYTAMNDDVEEIVSLFKVFADSICLRTLKALGVKSLCVCVLAEATNQNHLALSYRLKLLKEGGLVDSRREQNFRSTISQNSGACY
jgi:DNA-binding transcriptional ArsR family regulator